MSGPLAIELHALVARLDRAADRILQAEQGVSYRRFLALFAIDRLGATTQRQLADQLGVSEPSVSRMASVLAQDGLVLIGRDGGTGNRRDLKLSSAGAELVSACQKLLAERLAAVVTASQVPAEQYLHHTQLLAQALDAAEDQATTHTGPPSSRSLA